MMVREKGHSADRESSHQKQTSICDSSGENLSFLARPLTRFFHTSVSNKLCSLTTKNDNNSTEILISNTMVLLGKPLMVREKRVLLIENRVITNKYLL